MTLIRITLIILLLWQVWTHSHWSVALTIILLCLAVEAGARVTKYMIDDIKEMAAQQRHTEER